MKHPFILNAVWNGGRNSDGTIEAGQLKTQISIPKEMGGPGVGTNPDEMLWEQQQPVISLHLQQCWSGQGLRLQS